MLTDESVSLRRGIGRIPQPSDLVPPAVFVDVPAAPPSDLAPPAASMDTASPPPPPPSPPPPPADPPRQSSAPLTPAPPAAPPPKSKIVLPEVSAPGSVRDVLGWTFAFLTCSPAARRQQKLNERLWVAAARGDAEACQEMLGKGADVHAASHDGGEDPRLYFSDLYGLAFYEDQEKALEAGARPAHETAKPATKPPKRIGAPRTALGWAAYNGQAAAADLMLRAGADPEVADSEGYTPLHEAALYGHIEVVRVLLSHGASVNARTEERWVPLHLAAAYGHLEIVEQLQEAGADLCATTNGGLTAMDWAKAYGYVETAQFLRTCSGEGHGRCNFFIQGGIASKVASM